MSIEVMDKTPLFAAVGLACMAGAIAACSSSSSSGGSSPGDLDGSADVAQNDSASSSSADGSPDQASQTDAPASAIESGTGTDAAGVDSAGATEAGAETGAGGGGATCSAASDCRTHSDYCGGCTCDALGVSEPNPDCGEGGVASCFVDPCSGKTATCNSTHHCALQ
jgi:hypothetical protein